MFLMSLRSNVRGVFNIFGNDIQLREFLQRFVTHRPNHCKLYVISYLFVYLFTVCLDFSLINEAKNRNKIIYH